MLESLSLAWRLIGAFPIQRYLQLLPWHFTAVLIGLAVLAGFGLHHLIGFSFRFYNAGGRHRPLLAFTTLVVLEFSVLALLLAYVLRTQSAELIRPALTPENAVQPASVLGSILLDPAMRDDELADATHVAKAKLAEVIVATDDEDYRGDLAKFLISPSQLVLTPKAPETTEAAATTTPKTPPDGEPAHEFTRRDDLISAILVQIGLRWILDPNQTWPEAMPAGTGSTAAQNLRLPEFALALVDEIQDDAVLDRLDWEHVAGTRFVQVVLEPALLELVGRWAGLLALGVFALDLAYFAMAARLVGHLRRRSKAVTPSA
jgi:hypothetical protein